jgi:hypothetical protein
MSEKSRRIIRKVAELYSFGNERKTVEEVTQINYEKLLDKEEEWDKAFECYDISDVLQAVDNFWRYKSDKNRPSVSQILAFLSTEKDVEKKVVNEGGVEVKNFNIETELFLRDKACGRQKYPMHIYKRAVNKIMKDLMDMWCKENDFSFEDDNEAIERGKRYRKAIELGYFDEFDNILDKVAREYDFYEKTY